MRFSPLAAALFVVGALSGQNAGFALAEEDVAAAPTAQDVAAPTAQDVPIEHTPPEGAEGFEFEAEVHRMLDIVVNSLYQNKDVFLRELISNASDAIDKVRFMGLTKPELLHAKEELEIRIEYDADLRTLTIRDSGIGMTHDDLVSNLGTVARSGTTKFLEALQEQDKNDVNVGGMIGKFGVGFYSTFLVADRVTVASKSATSADQFVWESINGVNTFHIYPDPRGSTLGRGTEITLHLKDDCTEYADGDRLRRLIKYYSEFVTHPIHLRTTSTVEVEVEEEVKDEEEKKEGDDGVEVGEEEDVTPEGEEDAVEDKPKKYETVTTHDWEEINNNPAIWTREKESITDDEYQSFWKVVAKDAGTESQRWTHFNAEGNINFKSILYLPQEVPAHYKFGNIDAVDGGLKLYVRKVLISDEFDLLPRYLGFIRGVIDSDDLPLNVNRETLQESKIIKVIKKKLVRKALDMIRQFSREDMPEKEEKEVELDEEGNIIETDDDEEEKLHPYIEWYNKFNANLKMGVIDDEANRGKIVKLLRFETSKSDGGVISLDQYIENMKEWQKDIYVLAGANLDEIKNSPFMEQFNSKDIEVVYLSDPIDEYMVQQVRDYEGKKFSSISAENVKLEDEDVDMVKRREKAYKKKLKPLTKYLKKLYGGSVMRVAISKRLGSQPAIVSNSEYGHSANMERIMRAQAYQMGKEEHMMKAMKVLEINPRHPFVTKLLEGSPPEKEEEGAEPFVVSKETEDAAWLLYDIASLNGGFPIDNVSGHAKRVSGFLQASLGVDSLKLEDEIDPPEEDEEPDEFDMDGMGGLNMDDFNMGDMGDFNMDDLDAMDLD